MEGLASIMSLLMVALLWGVTNPLIKRSATGIEHVKASSIYSKFFKEIYFLLTNMQWLIPFMINQCGSVLYVTILQGADLSLVVPVTNSLTFVFTAVTGWILGEEKPHRNVYGGILLILAGTTLCCIDKLNQTTETLSRR